MSIQKPPRPDPLDVTPSAAPDTLTNQDAWVCWRYEWDADREEWTKLPVDVKHGGHASSTDPATWTSFEDAVSYHAKQTTDTDGIGFVLHDEATVLGLDLDDCRDPETGDRETWADHVLEKVPTYAEVSPSGTGLRLLGLGFVPEGGNRADIEDETGHIEMYDTGRYLTVTGHRIGDTPADVSQVHQAVKGVHGEYIASDAESAGVESGPGGVNPTPKAGKTESVSLPDDEILEKAKNAENGEKFRQLWNGDTAGYPSQSEADQALVNLLAFWTGGDRSRIDGLFRESGLYREKWDADRGDRTYGERTIRTALEGQTEFYDPDTPPERDGDENPTDGGALDGSELLAVLGYDEDATLADPPQYQLANGIESMLAARDDVHIQLLDTEDGDGEPFYAMNDETSVWEHKGERELAQRARSILGHHYRTGVQNELENALRSNVSGEWLLDRDTLGIDAGELALANGVIDLETRDLRDARPDDYLKGRLPTEYDPDASIDGTRFEEFLLQSLKPEDRDKLQEYAGYTLLANAQPYKKALFLVGPTNSGKGTFLKTLEGILGEENAASESLQSLVDTRWGTHAMYGNMVNVSNEVSPEGFDDIGAFKMLTGGEDKVTAEDKGVSTYRFTVTQKFLFATNEFPEVENADEAFYKRLLFAEFPQTVPDEDLTEHLDQKMLDDSSAILNWMLDGLDRLRENGGTFTGELSIAEKQAVTQAFGSTIEQFAFDAFDVTNNPDHVVDKKELYAAFARFCDFKHADTQTQTKFTTEVKKTAGVSDGKSTRVGEDDNRTDVFKGVRLNTEFFEKIQADVPSYSYENRGSGQTGVNQFD